MTVNYPIILLVALFCGLALAVLGPVLGAVILRLGCRLHGHNWRLTGRSPHGRLLWVCDRCGATW